MTMATAAMAIALAYFAVPDMKGRFARGWRWNKLGR